MSRVTSVLAISLPEDLPKKEASSSLILVGLTNPLGARFPVFLFLRLARELVFTSRIHFFSRARYSDLREEITTPNCWSLVKNWDDCSARDDSTSPTTTSSAGAATTGADEEAATGATTGAATTAAASTLVSFLATVFLTLGAATSTEAAATTGVGVATGAAVTVSSATVDLVCLVCLAILYYI